MRLTIVAILVAVTVVAQPTSGAFLAQDATPAATLLLPYFEVDLDDANGPNTVFRVNNIAPFPVLAHVVLWTDWAVPTLGFEIFLNGSGSVDVDLRDVFAGRLPGTVPLVLAAARTNGSIPVSCGNDTLDLASVTHINVAHSGGPSAVYGQRCAGEDFNDRRARGFITIDTLFDCTDDLPSDSEYFGETTALSNSNVLTGYYAFLNRTKGTSAGALLVSIEARNNVNGESFYSRFAASDGDDDREPLPRSWVGQYFNDARETDVITWRDPGQEVNPIPCGGTPPAFPLLDTFVFLRSPAGASFNASEFVPFPTAANRTTVGSATLPSPYPFGLLSLSVPSFPLAVLSGISIADEPQAFVTFLHRLDEDRAVMVPASSRPTPTPDFLP